MIIPCFNDTFHQVKKIPFPDIQKTFHGEEPKRNKILCPFHQEKTPSFHIYDDGFKCFGCGEYGDSLDFVAKLYEIKPLEAARLIAEKFGMPTDQGKETPKLSKEVLEAQRERALRKSIKDYEKRAFLKLAKICEWIRLAFRNEGLKVSDDINYLVHRLPMFENWLEVLAFGSEKEKARLLQDDDVRWWLCE